MQLASLHTSCMLTLPQHNLQFWGKATELTKFSDTDYLVPYSRSQGAIDAVMLPNRLFQMTIAQQHSIVAHHASEIARQLGSSTPVLIFVLPTDVYPMFTGEQVLISKATAHQVSQAQEHGVIPSASSTPPPITRVPVNLQQM
jgi:hypothetical protein